MGSVIIGFGSYSIYPPNHPTYAPPSYLPQPSVWCACVSSICLYNCSKHSVNSYLICS